MLSHTVAVFPLRSEESVHVSEVPGPPERLWCPSVGCAQERADLSDSVHHEGQGDQRFSLSPRYRTANEVEQEFLDLTKAP